VRWQGRTNVMTPPATAIERNIMSPRLRFIAMLLLVFTGLQAQPVGTQPADPVAVLIRQQLQPILDAPATGLARHGRSSMRWEISRRRGHARPTSINCWRHCMA
jgi:hypothetical protein